MEGVIVVVVVIGVIIYLIYQALPSTKFIKGRNKLESGYYIDAAVVFESIFWKHPDAAGKLAECKLKQGLNQVNKDENRAQKYFVEVVEIKKRLPAIVNKRLFELVEARANFEIYSYKFNKSLNINNEEDRILEIKNNLQVVDSIVKTGYEANFTELRLKHISALTECHFSMGKKYEKSNKVDVGMNHYLKAKELAESASYLKIKYDSAARIGICALKKRDQVDKSILNDIDKSAIDYKNDFYFRYARRLLIQKEYSEAEKVIQNNLNFSSPHVEKLKTFIKADRIKNAIIQIEKINVLVDQIYENSFQVKEIKKLYEKLDLHIEDIRNVVPSFSEKLQQLKPSLFNRLLMHYIGEEEYSDAIELIQGYPSFWEDRDLLKDIGICCYGLTNQGGLTKKNYKMIISSWLSSVFSDDVILKSLEDTTWDNEYTFTLLEAIGSKFNQHEDGPENVNYNEASERNISIGDSQKELLHQFELLIQQKISDNSIANLVHSFYDEERSSIEKIVSILDKDILFAGPHFAKFFGISDIIIDELDEKYYESNDENILIAGLPYFEGEVASKVGEYSNAKNLVSKLLSAIEDKDLDELESLTSDENKSLISEYGTINSSLEGLIYSSFASQIDEDDQDPDIIQLMEECIDFVDENDKLKYQYSNYVSNYAVQKVNDNEIDNYEALALMKSAYLNSDSNPRICKNFVTIILNSLMDIANDSSTDASRIYSLLDDIYWHRSEAFLQFSVELSKSRTDIILKLQRSGVSINLLTDETPFPMISIGSSVRLTPEGERMKKALSYMKKLSTRGYGELDPFSDTLERLLRSRV